MKRILLTRGLYTLVDDADYNVLAQYKWHVTEKRPGQFYAQRSGGKRGVCISMHVQLLDGGRADHKNGDTLDNRRENLRPATNAQNMRNVGKRRGSYRSRYKGVRPLPSGRWGAYICPDGQFIHLGIYGTEEEAASAYDRAATDLYGEFANLNIGGNPAASIQTA